MKRLFFLSLVPCSCLFSMDPTFISNRAVGLVCGKNDYLERVLKRNIERGDVKPYKPPLLCRCLCSKEREELRHQLANDVAQTQRAAIDVLIEQSHEPMTLSERNRVVLLWLLNSLLEQKLIDRDNVENANTWKKINGSAAVLMPLVVFAVQFIVMKYAGDK